MIRMKADPAGSRDEGHSTADEAICAVVRGKSKVRDRIFATACDLFYKHGIREVGVETIAAEAGTNKMSFYRSFASKDQLVAEYMRKKTSEFWLWWDDIVAEHVDDPRGQLEALFDAFVSNDCFTASRGCAIANAAIEIAERDHPARKVGLANKTEMRSRFRALASQAGARRADELGDGLMLLMEGGFVSRLTFGAGKGPLQSAARTARVLLDAYTDPARVRCAGAG